MITRRRFLQGLVAASVAPSLRAAGGRRPVMAYVGTYTPGGNFAEPYNAAAGNGAGILQFQLDPDTGRLLPRGICRTDTSPNWLAVNAARTRLYATNRGTGRPGSGAAAAYAIDADTGALTFLNRVSSGGDGPAHLSVHPGGRHVLVANYVGGSVAVLPLGPDGELQAPSYVQKLAAAVGPQHAASAPPGSFAISGHDVPHGHMIQADPSGRWVFACDLGTDRILVWSFDAERGRLVPARQPWVPLPPGDGPRHFVLHPNGRWFYSLQEEASTIARFDFDPAAGTLAWRRSVSSLPAGFAGSSFASELVLSGDGRYLYAANRLHDSVSAFAVGPAGELAFRENVWTRGDYPRFIGFDPSGEWLFSCNQRSDEVTCFRVDRQTGALAATPDYTPVGSPSMLTFA